MKLKTWQSYLFLFLFLIGMIFVIYLFLDTPVLKMKGSSNITLDVFSEYQEEGATARTFLQNMDSKVRIQGSVDTKKVGNMGYMFAGCTSLTSLDLSNFDTEKVLGMSSMFSGCESLTTIDVSTPTSNN